jgi:hypothetical protein
LNLFDAALDFLGSTRLDAFFGWPVVEAFDEAVDAEAALLRGERQRFFEYFRHLRRELRRGRLAAVILARLASRAGGGVPFQNETLIE